MTTTFKISKPKTHMSDLLARVAAAEGLMIANITHAHAKGKRPAATARGSQRRPLPCPVTVLFEIRNILAMAELLGWTAAGGGLVNMERVRWLLHQCRASTT